MRGAILTAVLILVATGSAGCAKNDCHRLAELSCNTDGTSAEDCRAARSAARRARTDEEIKACGTVLKAFTAPSAEAK
jgi:hypothetical protein